MVQVVSTNTKGSRLTQGGLLGDWNKSYFYLGKQKESKNIRWKSRFGAIHVRWTVSGRH